MNELVEVLSLESTLSKESLSILVQLNGGEYLVAAKVE